MKEWDGIERMGYKIPEDDGVVMISDYKQNVKEKAGVYRIYNEQDRIMYVGQSHNLKRRIGEHFRGKRKGYYIYRVREYDSSSFHTTRCKKKRHDKDIEIEDDNP
ncbi:hypothetical protein RhiirA1_404922 [Rhizophagus irregularis]|uniref:GIY-YIG domain-containing protein n=1 Tax=Rhizophagus irregularis TaxID=588596 RepID=A0A2N0QN58_9GLOM|nr:hypothetical protein RhiirA1_404922 [Rhizophagus irregularis]